ncbi:DUF1684 domain-containing protein [candidate division KSB1 bacterium]|nr:DUF1684 domain-containing protein [candidate division KSB1 bacterium]
MKLIKWSLVILALLILLSCQSAPKADPAYSAEIEEWYNNRITGLKKENSWLNLIGLFWLQEGVNTFGSDPNNTIIFPEKASPFLGKIVLEAGKTVLYPNKDSEILYDGKPVLDSLQLVDDTQQNTTILDTGELRWYIIKRGDRFGIRLRDLKHKLLTEFKGIDRFPVDEKWRISAKFERMDPPKTIEIPDILGGTTQESSYGTFVFTINGKTYRLETTGDPAKLKRMFVVFGDATNRKTTYGGGRFIYIPVPDEQGNSVIDFNKAYNPPCVFSPYATCPLPTEANTLDLAIKAGEQMWGDAHH